MPQQEKDRAKFWTDDRGQKEVQDREQEVYGCLKMVLDIRMPEWHQKMK